MASLPMSLSKRKIRNYVEMVKGDAAGYRIYIKEGIPLDQNHVEALKRSICQPMIKTSKPNPMSPRARAWMCANFFDVRTFGAVMRLV